MTTAQKKALGVAEAKAMNKATKEFTIVIMVDHERAARIYRQALTKIGLMMDDLSRAAEFFDKRAIDAHLSARAAWEDDVAAGDDAAVEPAKPKLRWNVIQNRIAYVKRMDALAQFAVAPFEMTEGQVYQLHRMETGDYFEPFDTLLKDWHEARGVGATA
ncbi:hypothetical protein 2A_00064 [Ralstonia phage Darius]|uniref:Uncharacterized protein n=2 Tax=Gervaisevirus gervaise TaxID=2846047 RepID=A0A7G5BAH5_9CAUD|nr:hypothetical protein KMC51_gp59 [Ralstonia phage Gervaise]QMV32816.1 hypothetical protein 2A_00064 [Ralstonia phage Darius]QMV33298.1 hypothetical protein 1Ca_00061 [Ralstonia phage Gervaise]